MGYYAKADGFLTFLSKEMLEKSKNLLSENSFEHLTSDTDHKTLQIYYEWQKYHTDSIMDCLDELAPLLTNGCINFIGEEDEQWQFKFNPATKTWEELEGYTIYGKPNIYILMSYAKQQPNTPANDSLDSPIQYVTYNYQTALTKRDILIEHLKEKGYENPASMCEIITRPLEDLY